MGHDPKEEIMPYKFPTSIGLSMETKERLNLLKGEDQSWDEFLTIIVDELGADEVGKVSTNKIPGVSSVIKKENNLPIINIPKLVFR